MSGDVRSLFGDAPLSGRTPDLVVADELAEWAKRWRCEVPGCARGAICWSTMREPHRRICATHMHDRPAVEAAHTRKVSGDSA